MIPATARKAAVRRKVSGRCGTRRELQIESAEKPEPDSRNRYETDNRGLCGFSDNGLFCTAGAEQNPDSGAVRGHSDPTRSDRGDRAPDFRRCRQLRKAKDASGGGESLPPLA